MIPELPKVGSVLAYLAALPDEALDRLLGSMALTDLAHLHDREAFDWRLWARPEQLPPAGDWRVWGMQAGRGAGKTKAGASWCAEMADQYPGCRIGLFGPTAAKVRDVMVEDAESGILACAPPRLKPRYEPSKRRVTFANGSRCITYSADNPDQSRGANLHFAWADEVGEWPQPEAWSNLDMALRKAKEGLRPRIVVTTTPRPTDLIRDIFQGPKTPDGTRAPISWDVLRAATPLLPAAYIARPTPDTVITRWGTRANRANLAADFLRRMEDRYGGTRLGRQELDAEILEDVVGALWSRLLIDKWRLQLSACPRMDRLVVAVDPSHADDGGGDACGIIVVGIGGPERHGYIRADRTLRASPLAWGEAAIRTFDEFRADLIVYEDNESPRRPSTVRDVIRAVDPGSRIKWLPIHASRDKRARADPVSALYEKGKVHHVTDPNNPDDLSLLEDEMVSWDATSRLSPNRLDALVYGVSYLMLGASPVPAVAPGSLTRSSPWR
jgi:phage terminase large subunit-like protein